MKYIIKYSILLILLICLLIFLDKKYGRLDMENFQAAASTTRHADVTTLVSLVNNVREQSETSNVQLSSGPNDGQARAQEDIYGHLSDADPIDDSWEYYDCAVPYMLKTTDIGGLQCEGEDDHGYYYPPRVTSDGVLRSGVSDYYVGGIGTRGGMSFDDLGIWNKIYDLAGTPTNNRTPEKLCDNLGIAHVKINDVDYYFTALQGFFYPDGMSYHGRRGFTLGADPANYNDYGYTHWNNVGGELCDAILTDGTVIHFIVTDANSNRHTNHGLGYSDEPDSFWALEQYWRVSNINPEYKQYACLFSCHQQTCLELAGNGSNYTNEFTSKFEIDNTTPEGRRVAYVRMYNKTVDDLQGLSVVLGEEIQE